MAAETLVESKFEASKQLVDELIARDAPLLAAYWEFREAIDRWTLNLIPNGADKERVLLKQAVDLLGQQPYRQVFSLSDPSIDSRQIERARALGAYIRMEAYVGRRIDSTFTGDQFFESVVPVYLRPELMTHLSVAS
jgi:hypothetical protein